MSLKAKYERVSSALLRAVRSVLPRCIAALPTVGAILLGTVGVASAYAYFGMYRPPALFPIRTMVTIPEGVTITTAADLLAAQQVIRSAVAFRAVLRVVEPDAEVRAGDYSFDRRLTLLETIKRVTRGEFGLEPVTITIPEGATTYRMAELFAEKLVRFDATAFEAVARDKEGYLYPDTYLFLPNATAPQVLDAMERTFYERLRTVEDKIAAFGRPLHEVVTLASLLEKEAYRDEDRREIAGVLWRRLAVGMPLQVDAVFGYIERRETFSPKYSNLEVDSPYNTYRHTGLPPGPIGSPSIAAIEAAVTPEETTALYYLHGRDGSLHLARTFSEHIRNRRRYLD